VDQEISEKSRFQTYYAKNDTQPSPQHFSDQSFGSQKTFLLSDGDKFLLLLVNHCARQNLPRH